MATTTNRIAVVTGANKGIGFAIVESLMKLSDRPVVVLTSRNEELGQEAIKKLLAQTSEYKDSLYYHQLDIANDGSADAFRDWLKEKFGKIDVLINNAGVNMPGEIMNPDNQPTEEDFNYVVGTNYFKTRALTEKLLPLLSDDGKIINISSGEGAYKKQGETAHKILLRSDLKDKDIQDLAEAYKKAAVENKLKEAGFTPSPYAISKALLNAWIVHVLLKQVKENQQVYAVCPGPVDTDLARRGPKNITMEMIEKFKPYIKTPTEGADTAVYLTGLPYKRDDNLHGKALRYREVRTYENF